MGPGSGDLAISGNNASRVFAIDRATVTISGVTITNGSGGSGPGIFNSGGNVTLTGSTVSGNTATKSGSKGGGIINSSSGTILGTMTLTNSTVSANTADAGGGGGIYNDGEAP